MEKILQISNYMYPHVGGIEQVARDIAQALSQTNVEQRIICFNEDAADGARRCRRRETTRDIVDGVDVVRCGCAAKIRSQSISLTYPRELKRILAEFSPDVVVFHYPNPFEARWLLKELPPETKLILYWHLDIVKQIVLRGLFRGQNEALIRRADRIVATSVAYIDGSPWLSQCREKCVVIPNCINEERMRKTARSDDLAGEIRRKNRGKIICLAVGRHIRYKGIAYLVQAAKQLDERTAVYIIGRGDETKKLMREAERDPKIHFLGTVSDDELKAWLTAADIFCFPSITKNEAFGLALAEAMYYGKPAVTFTIPGSGVNEICPNGQTGIEVPNRDVDAYAKAIRTLADDKRLRARLGANGRKRAEKELLFSQFGERIRALLNGIEDPSSPGNAAQRRNGM